MFTYITGDLMLNSIS